MTPDLNLKSNKTITMNRFFSLVSLVFLLVSCTKPNDEASSSTVLKLNGTSEFVEIEAAQNQVPISFTTNQSWTVFSDANWISVTPDNGIFGDASIVALVEENTTSSDRYGKVTIKAVDISKVVSIKQRKKSSNPAMEKISISVTDIDASSATLSAAPSSSKMYFLSMTDKSSWDNEGGDAIWDTNINLLKQQGTLSQALHTGNFSYQITYLDSQTEYVVFAAFCDKNGIKSGEIFTCFFATKELGPNTPDNIYIDTDVALLVGQSYKIAPSCQRNNVSLDKADIKWESTSPSVATIAQDGTVKAIKEGTATIKVRATYGTAEDECTVYVNSDYSSPVDLGLSIKWAQCNLGVNTPYERGCLYYWGGISSKYQNEWNWSYVPFNGGRPDYYQAYFQSILDSVVDDDNNLLLSNDAPHLTLGGNWRMPTKKECEELVENCSAERISLNGQYGYMLKSKKVGFTDKWLFLSFVSKKGYSYDYSESYWTSTIFDQAYTHSNVYEKAYSRAYQIDLYDDVYVNHFPRNDIALIRPVYSNTQPDYFDITVSNTTYHTCVVSISTNMPNKYFRALVEKSEWDQKGGETVCKEVLSYYKENGTLNLRSGNVSLQYSSLETHGEYVFFACFINENGQIGDYYHRFISMYNIDY